LVDQQMNRVAVDPNVVTVSEGETGRVVRVGRGELSYQAFVPNPLPPTLTMDSDLINGLSAADRAIGELAGLGRMLPNPDLLIDPFVRREAVLSSKIEGTQATITEVYSFEAEDATAGAKRRPPNPDVQEVINYISATRYGLDRVKTLPVSLRLITELHSRLLSGVRGGDKYPGEFRRTQNWIGAPNCLLKDATYVPPPTAEMTICLEQLEGYVHEPDDWPPLVRLAMIHGQFEMIHPFIDGNGRIGRLLVTLLLVDWNVLPLPLLYLSAFFERERDAYYDRLHGISERAAWKEWVLFFLRGVAEQACDGTDRAKKLQDLQAQWRAQLTGPRASALMLRLVDHLFITPVITVPRAQALLGVTYPSAKHTVEKLVDIGVLEPFDARTYGKTWWAPKIVAVVS
jgi:Fic family protein